MDVSFGIFLLFLTLVLVVPFLLSVISGYEAPASFSESLRRVARGTWTGCAIMVGMNLGRVGLDFSQWYWETLLVIAALIGLQLFIDWLAMRREAKRTTI